jgi:hypothetical protein
MAIFLIWLVRNSLRIWRTSQNESAPLDLALSRAGTLIVVLLLLHSFVDYPLRTIAMMSVFAFACGLMVPPQKHLGPEARQSRRPSRHGHRDRSPAFAHALST